MPNNQQKEKIKCKVCGKPLDDNHCFTVANGKTFNHIPEQPESIVTSLEEDRKTLIEWYVDLSEHTAMYDLSKEWVESFIEDLLAAQERVVRAECAEIVDEAILICDHCEGHELVREAKSKILNNSPL